MSAKNPRTPGALTIDISDLHTFDTTRPLFRIHTIKGNHPMAWNGLREFGPLELARWDPHPPPRQHHPGVGVTYCATDPITAFAEVFQNRRRIRVTSTQAITAWFPIRPLRLLDLTGLWATRHGASASLSSAQKSTCRNWAHAIHHHQGGPTLDGLYALSTMTHQPMVVLFSPAASAFPSAPQFSQLLSHPAAQMLAVRASHKLGWPVS